MTEKTFDVVAIGNAIVDVLARTDDAFLAEHGMAKGSMQLVDEQVARSIYDAMGPAVEVSGGSAANTTAGVASLGGRAAFIGRVADDLLGQVFTHDIRAAGVHFDPLAVVPDDRGTGRCLVLVTADAQRTMNTALGVAGLLGPDDVDLDLVASAKVLYCEGYLWDQPETKDALVRAMDAAASAGTKVAFTLSDAFCVDRHRAEFLELAEHKVDILFANEAELCSLYETASWEEAATRVAGHCEIACLTRSEHGSVVITAAGERVAVEAHVQGPVVDTTGAGDLYAAGFLHGLAQGCDLITSARLGSMAAGEVISHVGARPEVSLAELAATVSG